MLVKNKQVGGKQVKLLLNFLERNVPLCYQTPEIEELRLDFLKWKHTNSAWTYDELAERPKFHIFCYTPAFCTQRCVLTSEAGEVLSFMRVIKKLKHQVTKYPHRQMKRCCREVHLETDSGARVVTHERAGRTKATGGEAPVLQEKRNSQAW